MALFADKTFEAILAEALKRGEELGVDTREGSLFYDAVAGPALIIARQYANLDTCFELVFISTTSGEYLSERAKEYGLERTPAIACCYYFHYEGTRPEVGRVFYMDTQYFTLQETEDGVLYLQANTAGESQNYIAVGTPAVPAKTVEGLASAYFGQIMIPGAEEESDESLRTRVWNVVSGRAENGNASHYKKWCEEVQGVGRARIIPLWDGENTVKGVLIGTDGTPATDAVVARVQEYIDPDSLGIGAGTANIGAHFTAIAAESVTICVKASVSLLDGADEAEVTTEIEQALTGYLKELALDSNENEEIVVRVSQIGALLYGSKMVNDYSDLTINDGTANITMSIEQCPVIGYVEISRA